MANFKVLPKEFSPDFNSERKKPIGQVEIDRANPLSSGISYAVLPTNINIVEDIASGEVIPSITTGDTPLVKVIDKDGISVGYSRASSGAIVNSFTSEKPPFSDARGVSAIFGTSWDRLSRGTTLFSGTTRTSFTIPSTSSPKFVNINLANISDSSRLQWSIDTELTTRKQLYTVAFSASHSPSEVSSFIDGIKSATTITLDTIGGSNFGTSVSRLLTGANGYLSFLYIFDRKLNDSDLVALSLNPYQILKPKTYPVYYPIIPTIGGFKPWYSINSNP